MVAAPDVKDHRGRKESTHKEASTFQLYWTQLLVKKAGEAADLCES